MPPRVSLMSGITILVAAVGKLLLLLMKRNAMPCNTTYVN